MTRETQSPLSRARRSVIGLRSALVVAAMVVAAPLEVCAQSSDAERTAMARALFTEGVERARGEQYAEAVDLFSRAQALRPAPAIAFNLGNALVRLGRLVEASEQLRSAVRAPETPPEMRAVAESTLGELTPRLARVSIRLTGEHDDVALRVDERPLDRAVVGVAVPIDPGTHVLTAWRGEQEVARAEVTLAEGAAGEATLDIPPPPARDPEPIVLAEAPDAPVAPPTGESFEWLLWTTIGVVVAAAAAITATLLVLDQQNAIAEPTSGTTIPPILEWD